MLNPTINIGHTFILWIMSYEALIWPTMNIAANAFFIFAAIFFGFSHLIFFWWAGLAILDLSNSTLLCRCGKRRIQANMVCNNL